MTVKELIEKLKELPQDAQVQVPDSVNEPIRAEWLVLSVDENTVTIIP